MVYGALGFTCGAERRWESVTSEAQLYEGQPLGGVTQSGLEETPQIPPRTTAVFVSGSLLRASHDMEP